MNDFTIVTTAAGVDLPGPWKVLILIVLFAFFIWLAVDNGHILTVLIKLLVRGKKDTDDKR